MHRHQSGVKIAGFSRRDRQDAMLDGKGIARQPSEVVRIAHKKGIEALGKFREFSGAFIERMEPSRATERTRNQSSLCHQPSSHSANFVNCFTQAKKIDPVGPLRCFAIMISASPAFSSVG